MDNNNQDQRRTHTQGHESHGVHVCHKCGWPFPNSHPSAKHRRAHKKICGTTEGYQLLLVSESQIRCNNASDGEHLSDDDHNNQANPNRPLVLNSLDTGENKRQSCGTGENLIRSGDEVFLDAITNFSDGALSPGIKDPLRDSLGSATDVDVKYPEFSGYSEDNDFNGVSVSENVRDCSMTSVAKEITLKGRDETISDRDMIEIMVSSDYTVGETCEGVPKYEVNSDCQVADGAFNLTEENNAEFLSVMPQDELPLEVNSTVSTNSSTNSVQVVEPSHMTQFATSSDVSMMQEREVGNIDVFTFPLCDDGSDVAHPQNKYQDVKDHEGLLSQNSLSLHSSEALKQKREDLKDSVAGENDFLINQNQLSKKREVLPDVHVLGSTSMKEQNNSELVDEGMHAEEGIEVSSVNFMVGSDKSFVEINSNGKGNEECNKIFGGSVDSHQTQDEELIVKAAEDLGGKYSSFSFLNFETKAQCGSVVEDAQDGEPGRKAFEIESTVVPVQDQSGNGEDKLASSAIHTSVDSGSQFDNLEGNWGSVSVSGLPSTGLLASTEAGKFNLKDPKEAALDRQQQCEKQEMFEPPSFMTLVEPGHVVSPKAAAPEVQKEPNQHTSSQAGWFPTMTHITTNESQGRKRNEEKIAKITNWSSPSRQYTPLKTLLGEAAAHNKKPKSQESEETSIQEDSGSGLTTGDSILGPESPPTTQAVKGKDKKDPAAGIKRENKKGKGRPYWKQFVCCSSVDSRRR